MAHKRRGSVGSGIGWMIFLSIILFWLPFGPFIAGFVGGRKSGSLRNAILAAIFPALIVGLFVGILFSLAYPILGIASGTATFVALLFQSSVLIFGAVLGGLTV
ncbi:MAG: hypothetical protein ACOCP4_06730 [Candidatus Woesearchaeota archaeon]